MKQNFIPILIITAFVMAFIGYLLAAPKSFRSLKLTVISASSLFCSGLRDQFATANTETATGTHKVRNLRSDAAHTYTHLLIKQGSDAFHGAVCGAANYPIGVTTDSPDAAEDLFQVHPLSISDHTRRMRCATALAAEIDLYTAANGFVQGEPTVAGTYWRVGRSVALAVIESTSNYVVEVEPCRPVKVVVIAALTSAQEATADGSDAATTQALANALKDSYNALQVDVAAIGAALATPAEVKVLV